MRLQEILNTSVFTIGPDETADAAWTIMRRKRIRHLIVTGGRGDLVGVISDRDLGGARGAETRRGRSVRELMTASPATATPTTTLRQAANLMRGRLIGSLPVVEDGRVVGIVTATDVLDELGRGSTRPEVRARRQSMRVPPASARRATARARSPRPARRKGPGGGGSGDGGGEDRPVPTSARTASARVPVPPRTPDSPRRAPLAKPIDRSVARSGAAQQPSDIPAFIRAPGLGNDAPERTYLRRKLGRKLGKFATSIQRVSVRLEDVNGPRGGIDKICRIKVTLRGRPPAIVESSGASMRAAMDGALARLGSAVKRPLQRRRDKPREAQRLSRQAERLE